MGSIILNWQKILSLELGDTLEGIPEFPRGHAVVAIRLVIGYDCLAGYLLQIRIIFYFKKVQFLNNNEILSDSSLTSCGIPNSLGKYLW